MIPSTDLLLATSLGWLVLADAVGEVASRAVIKRNMGLQAGPLEFKRAVLEPCLKGFISPV